jgi:hypothetical protein
MKSTNHAQVCNHIFYERVVLACDYVAILTP